MRLSETQTGRRAVCGKGTASAMSEEASSKSSMGLLVASSPPVACVRLFVCFYGSLFVGLLVFFICVGGDGVRSSLLHLYVCWCTHRRWRRSWGCAPCGGPRSRQRRSGIGHVRVGR